MRGKHYGDKLINHVLCHYIGDKISLYADNAYGDSSPFWRKMGFKLMDEEKAYMFSTIRQTMFDKFKKASQNWLFKSKLKRLDNFCIVEYNAINEPLAPLDSPMLDVSKR